MTVATTKKKAVSHFWRRNCYPQLWLRNCAIPAITSPSPMVTTTSSFIFI